MLGTTFEEILSSKAGFGNGNDENTSKLFSAPQTSRITDFDINLIKRCNVLLEVLSSGHKLNIKKIENYAEETAKLYVELYGWHPMTPTMHKFLRRGLRIIDHVILPIGQLSEEVAEVQNKHFRTCKEGFVRKL